VGEVFRFCNFTFPNPLNMYTTLKPVLEKELEEIEKAGL
jgi:hypothetical protein